MEIQDRIYGQFSITNPVLVDLIASPPVQRLKGINQYSLPPEFYHLPGFSRYDHCLGVMLLLRRLQAPLEEQIAGLLHDVSHSAFSHIMDRIMNTTAGDTFQDSIHEQFIRDSVIPAIMDDHGFSVDRIIDYDNFPLLERELPDLCADRVDYGLQEFRAWANPFIVQQCVDDLRNHNQEIVFASYDSAKQFALTFAKCHIQNWGSSETAVRSTIFAKALRHAMNQEIISMEDLAKKDDAYVMGKLTEGKDRTLEDIFSLLRGTVSWRNAEQHLDIDEHKKLRCVDPKFWCQEELRRLSEVDVEYKRFMEELKQENEKGMKIKILYPQGEY